ncbi:MAG: polysaccharide biosynthesis C-terminal domain-containing protein, partial [Methanobacteriota archaeon]
FFIIAPEFVTFILGDRWTPAVVALQILCLFGFIRVILQPAGDLFLAKGKTKCLSITNAVNLVIMIIFLYPAILWGGIEGVALLVFLIYFFHTIIIYWLTTRLLNIKYRDITNTFADPLIASLLMLLVVFVFKIFAGISLAVFVASILIGIVAYLAFIWALSRRKIRYYLREIMSMIRQRA